MGRTILETIIGAIVLCVAGGFLFFAYHSAGITSKDGYDVIARFDRIDGINVGSDVRISGVKVGTVVGERLDPQSFMAELSFRLDNSIKLPKDTSAEIVSSSLLGGKYVSLSPGAEDDVLKEGERIQFTQSAVNLEALLGKFIFGAADNKDKEQTPSDDKKEGGSGL